MSEYPYVTIDTPEDSYIPLEVIASDWNLWIEYVDPYATMTQEEFSGMTLEEKLKIINDAFGDTLESY